MLLTDNIKYIMAIKKTRNKEQDYVNIFFKMKIHLFDMSK